MSVGVVILVHTALDRAGQIARHWVQNGCPVVIHVDARVSPRKFEAFVQSLVEYPDVKFCKRIKCNWGTWSLVRATQAGSEIILDSFPAVRHVLLASGSCLPLRPINELVDYLDRRPKTDFIESVTTRDVYWAHGGFETERFTLRFPFPWKRRRRAFDAYVRLQRRFKFKRKIPERLTPHLGSQWWCLTRQTLSAILEDPDRDMHDRYFSRVWIPDESYFQTLARLYSPDIESRSLTLSKFDFQGRPHVFYDDHLQLLRQSDCFVARKIWPNAERLYSNFLLPEQLSAGVCEPNPAKIDKIFSKAIERRVNGRAGLYMQSRFPREGFENGKTSAPYSVFEGFSDVFEGFEEWLQNAVGGRVHGHLYAPKKVEFGGRQKVYAGSLSDSAPLRDYNPRSFLTNLIWATRGERQSFQFGPVDNQDVSWLIATDQNAQISVISGAWAIGLFNQNKKFSEIRTEAARLQRIETEHIKILNSFYTKARVRIWTLAEFVESPMEPLQGIIDEIGPRHSQSLTEAPSMVNLDGFGQFLQNLKNQGMHPQLMGDFPVGDPVLGRKRPPNRPYLVK